MKRIVEFAYDFIEEYIDQTSIVVDFTMGNGNDTLKLARLVPNGHLYAFDIQPIALKRTQEKLEKEGITNTTLILDSHHLVRHYVTSYHAGMFNFGYLPKGDPSITTLLKTSVEAVNEALCLLEVKGILILVLYPGHDNGNDESEYFDEFASKLDSYYYNVFKMSIPNKDLCPYIIGIEKCRKLSD